MEETIPITLITTEDETMQEDVTFSIFYNFALDRDSFLMKHLEIKQCLRCGATCENIPGKRLIVSFPGIFCCKCFAEFYELEKDSWCHDCRGRKAIENLYKELDYHINHFYLGQIELVSEAINRARNHDFFTVCDFEVESFCSDMEYLLEKDPALIGKILLKEFTWILDNGIKKNWAEMKTCGFIERLRMSIQNHLLTIEILEANAQAENLYHYDLIELRGKLGHIPVPKTSSFWRKFFLRFAKKKVRNKEFFVCPWCGATSFYSQWENGCNKCEFHHRWGWSPREKLAVYFKMRHKRNRKQTIKRFLLKTGLWIFFVKAYVKSPYTKRKVSRERVEKFIKSMR
ncbi:MAG: hypothetical protein GF308_11700 [Candidatus Heimdallarchaeota archaeon]|nr:hypothetical protein [Candidatus Heimdallarchaeota archaeon]